MDNFLFLITYNEFNIREAKKRQERIGEQGDQTGETKEEAKERLLFDRVTMQKYRGGNPSIIYEGEVPESELSKIEPESVSPGVVPKLLGGKKPKCFFALLKSFLGATLMGFAPEPENVYLLLDKVQRSLTLLGPAIVDTFYTLNVL